jgi:hypothetical protein
MSNGNENKDGIFLQHFVNFQVYFRQKAFAQYENSRNMDASLVITPNIIPKN